MCIALLPNIVYYAIIILDQGSSNTKMKFSDYFYTTNTFLAHSPT